MASAPGSAEGGGRRKKKRKESWATCTLQSRSGHTIQGVVLNISQTGIRVRFRVRSSLPAKVRFRCERYQADRLARVVWQDTYDAGLEFIDPLEQPV